MYDSGIMKTKVMRNLAMNGRQYDLTFINCMQYMMDMPPAIRGQVDYVICLKENIRANKERLYKYFFGMFNHLSDFCLTLDQITDNYGALVLDNTCPTSNLSDCLYWYKGVTEEKIPQFRLGRPCYFKLSKMYKKQARSVNTDDDKLEDIQRKNPNERIDKIIKCNATETTKSADLQPRNPIY
jgi:hypothetical protein